jgi:hypothetical protein
LLALTCQIFLQHSFAQTSDDSTGEKSATSTYFKTHPVPVVTEDAKNTDTSDYKFSNAFQNKAEAVTFDHLQFTEKHQQRTFMWQYYSGIFLFIMVIAIVVMGLLLSFKQFQLTAEQVKYNLKTSREERVVIENGDSTSMEISQTGLKINTAVIGLAILFLSLAFFFLYLKYVYVIEVVDTGL